MNERSDLANALLTQAFQAQNTAKPGIHTAAATLAQAMLARKLMDKQDAQRLEMQNQNAMDMSNALSAYRGDTPYQPSPQETFDSNDTLPQGLKNQGSGSDTKALAVALMQAKSPNLQELGLSKVLENPAPIKWDSTEVGVDGNPTKMQRIAYNSSDPKQTQLLGSPYEKKALVDMTTNTPAPTESQTDKTANYLGVPNTKSKPWAGVGDQKEQAKMQATTFKESMDAIQKYEQSDQYIQSAQLLNRAKRFKELNEKINTGTTYAIPGVANVGATMDSDIAEAKAITDSVTPLMRQGLPGSATERDVAMFRGATFGLNKPKQANDNIANGLIAVSQNAKDHLQYLKDYNTQHKNITGADLFWNEYLEANPIFDTTNQNPSLNPNRRTYQEYFKNLNETAKKYNTSVEDIVSRLKDIRSKSGGQQ